MEERNGQRPGSRHLHYSGFCYNRDIRAGNEMRYVCVKRTHRHIRCKAILIRPIGGLIILRGEHCHPGDPLCNRKQEMRKHIQRLARQTALPARLIVEMLTRR